MESTYAVAVDPATSVIGRALHDASADGFTGALVVTGSVGTCRLYCFEGAPYAATVPGLAPDATVRLRSAERIGPTEDVRTRLADQHLQPEELASVHQEFLLAVIGRLSEVPGLVVERVPRAATSTACTLPIGWDALMPILRLRQTRLAEDIRHVGGTTSSEVVLAASGACPEDLPESRALWAALGEGSELDQAAYACGFTRAEALHLAARLLGEGRATVLATRPRAATPARVPEALGSAARR